MVAREYAQCTVCLTRFVLRVGVGLEESCPHTFDCPSCHSPITVLAKAGPPPRVWVEMGENAVRVQEDPTITTYVNLHPSVAFRVDDYHSPTIFASFMLLYSAEV